MKVNWKVRARNKAFWIAIIPTTLLLIQQLRSHRIIIRILHKIQ